MSGMSPFAAAVERSWDGGVVGGGDRSWDGGCRGGDVWVVVKWVVVIEIGMMV